MDPQNITIISGSNTQFQVNKKSLVFHSPLFNSVVSRDSCVINLNNVKNRTSEKKLSSISDKTLSTIIKFCNNYNTKPNFLDKNYHLTNFDMTCFNGGIREIMELTLSAIALEINSICDLVSRFLSDYIHGRSNGELRKMFNLQDHNDDEIENIRKQFELTSIDPSSSSIDTNTQFNENEIPDISTLFE